MPTSVTDNPPAWIRRNLRWIIPTTATGWIVIVFLPSIWLSSNAFSAWATALQALLLVPTLGVGVWTIRQAITKERSDVSARKYQAAQELNEEITAGPVSEARHRLLRRLNEVWPNTNHPRYIRLAIQSFRPPEVMGTYPTDQSHAPAADISDLMRFFERCQQSRLAGRVDEMTLVRGAGRHATWWNCLIEMDTSPSRVALEELALWANSFVADISTSLANEPGYTFAKDWGKTRMADFGIQ